MARYADVDKTLEKLNCLFKESNVKYLDFMRIGYNHAVADSIALVKGQPIVEVVRCKDCIYSKDKRACNLPYGENGYCPLGERSGR